jgi:8-oxo-dGTP pyrophosphatase MutT (NUDIX family)
MTAIDPPAIPRPATSVLLLRDSSAGIEVFMATRHAQSSFMAGALVFPGGALDPDDARPHCAAAGGEEDAAWRIAGIRELFEEAGMLLARQAGEPGPVPIERLDRLLKTYRNGLCRGEIAFSQMMADEGLSAATDALTPFAHWATPRFAAKRFDTRFYLAEAPHGQIGAHDQLELTDSRWITPAQALAEHQGGRIRLVFVTRANLGLLAKSATVAQALEAARGRRIVRVEPEMFEGPGGRMLRIPADAGYDVTEILMAEAGAAAGSGR